MRALWVGVVLSVAVLFPTKGNAQVFQFRTPPPDVSAAGAAWQINGEPVVVGGLTFYPTRGFRLFDGVSGHSQEAAHEAADLFVVVDDEQASAECAGPLETGDPLGHRMGPLRSWIIARRRAPPGPCERGPGE